MVLAFAETTFIAYQDQRVATQLNGKQGSRQSAVVTRLNALKLLIQRTITALVSIQIRLWRKLYVHLIGIAVATIPLLTLTL